MLITCNEDLKFLFITYDSFYLQLSNISPKVIRLTLGFAESLLGIKNNS